MRPCRKARNQPQFGVITATGNYPLLNTPFTQAPSGLDGTLLEFGPHKRSTAFR